MTQALIIGAGPAGLMAADVLSAAGVQVILVDQMPSPARKLLMAGKSGLNLTKAQDQQAFIAAFGELPETMQQALADFGPDQVQEWARGLGQKVFTGSTGRVFPRAMKASPLVRAWLLRLNDAGVQLRTRWNWKGWQENAALFATPDGPQEISADVTVLALGGASWRRLGSNGEWAGLLTDVAPFQPANMGFVVRWSPHMNRHFGTPVKGCALLAGGLRERGEFVISQRGLEGGGIYALSRKLREGAELNLDLLPDVTPTGVAKRLERPKGKTSMANHLRKSLRITGVKAALLNEFGQPLGQDLARKIKALPITLAGPRPMDEAISTAGGLRFEALDGWMLKQRTGVFVAGEMLDWEAPTGGYLVTGCLASGRAAGAAALTFLEQKPSG